MSMTPPEHMQTDKERAVYWKARCKAIEGRFFSLVRTLDRLHATLGPEVIHVRGIRRKDRIVRAAKESQ